ncbi:MAG TPA: nitrilase-related carbon-nitrogen hydrolase [Solirubrobacteraceae bacterium]
MRVACCQIEPDVGSPESSAARARAALAAAIDRDARIVVLPELCNSGYVFRSTAEALAAAVPADGALLAGWVQEAARGDAVVIGGFCELGDDGEIFNSSAIVDRDGVVAVYRKLHLWDQEQRWFARGPRPAPVVETRHGRIGLGVCYDIEFPELTRGLALGGADLIALPTNWPLEKRDPPMLRSLAVTTAYLNRVFVAVCDRAGSERGLDFHGGSVIAAPDGTVLAAARAGAHEETLLVDCELQVARDKHSGSSNDVLADRRPEQYPSALVGRGAVVRTE